MSKCAIVPGKGGKTGCIPGGFMGFMGNNNTTPTKDEVNILPILTQLTTPFFWTGQQHIAVIWTPFKTSYNTLNHSTVQHSELFYIPLHYIAGYRNILPYYAILYITLPYFTAFCNVLQYSAIFYITLQYYTTLLIILQHSEIFYIILQYLTDPV